MTKVCFGIFECGGAILSKIHVVIPDTHAHFEHHNRRAEWIGKLILDVKPNAVIHLGDSADMPSLSSYDRGTKAFQGRTYRADIDSHLDFSTRLMDTIKSAKRKLPARYILEGNHEHRIKKAINLSPELEGAISPRDLDMLRFYDEYIEYDGRSPGILQLDGIDYAHFFISGVLGKAIGGTHAAYSILQKRHGSSTAGDLHLLSYDTQTGSNNRRIHGLVAGCCHEYRADWAGLANELWWRGVIVKRNVDNGSYDPQFISLESLRREYGGGR